MSVLRSFPALVFALVLLGIGGFGLATRSIELLLVAGALAAMSWYITEGPRGRALPRWTSNVLVIAVSISVFVDVVRLPADEWMAALGRFTVWLTLIKLYERKGPRDYAQLMALSLLLMLTACWATNDLLFALVLVAYCVLGLYVLLLFQLHASYERGRRLRAEASPRGSRFVPAVKPVFGRHVGLQFRLHAIVVGALGLLLASVVFVAFPRDLGRGMVSTVATVPRHRRVGFSPEMNLYAGGRISESHRAVLDVRVLDRAGRPLRLPGPLLLRGAVLTAYADGAWTPAKPRAGRVETEPGTLVPLGDATGETPWAMTVEITPRSTTGGALFAPWAPVAIRTPRAASLRFDHAVLTIACPEREPAAPSSYEVRCQTRPGPETLEALAAGAPSAGGARISLPGRDARRVRALALEILAEANVPAARPRGGAAMEEAWVRTAASALRAHLVGGEYVYTTDLGMVARSGEDPVATFLLETKRGHCEFFASALVVLCDALAIEARVVVGYAATEYDDQGGLYLVRDRHAHAWAEIRTSRRAWMPLDPTPAAVHEEAAVAERSLADRMSWLYDGIEHQWNSTIVPYDSSMQQELSTALDLGWSERLTSLLDGTRERLRRVNQAFYLGPAGYIWMAIVATALVIAIVALVKLMRRTWRIRRTAHLEHLSGAEYQRMLRQLGFYLDMLGVLHRGGHPKPAWQPPRDFAAAVARRAPEAGALAERITGVFYDVRYGRRRLDAAGRADMRRLVEELAAAIKAGT